MFGRYGEIKSIFLLLAAIQDYCLLASVRLDPFCDTTFTLFTPNLTVEDRLDGYLHDFRALSFVAKMVGNNYCTDTSVQPATVYT